ncbi:DNA cytosine methyltransferase [Actinokineospora sp.]|uniref:DNA cytosine methyltransferase n=1 Tax=Actinokineospora sp. TaxID=1872133 RepID=UPI003D6A2F68
MNGVTVSTGGKRHRPRLLDLCCKAGGASAGYHAAGFDVVGVDIEPQPHYPFPFIHADALTVDLSGFDVIAASPPCQAFSQATPTHRRDAHPDLVAPIRQRLIDAVAMPGGPWAYVIENVPGAPLIDPVTVCGDTLRLGVRRHRLFESNVVLHGTPCHHDRSAAAVPVYGSYGQRSGRKPLDVEGETSPTTEQARAAMGIDWMPWPALTQAIPPAFTFWLGAQLIAQRPHRSDASPAGTGALDLAFCGEEAAGLPSPRRETEPTRALTSPLSSGLPSPVTHRACHCGQPLRRPDTGRWPRHCSHACRQAAYRARQTITTRRTA